MQSLLWLTATVGLALMYLRPAGREGLICAALVVVGSGMLGVVVGSLVGRLGVVLYWSVLGAMFAFISTVGGRLIHETAPFAWAALGAGTGCVVSSMQDARWWRCMLAGAAVAGMAMSLYALALQLSIGRVDRFDLACSVPIGALFGLLVVAIRRVELRSSLRYDALATLLTAAVVAGNQLSRLVAPIAVLLALLLVLPGCGESAPAVDPAPFEAAVTSYLAENDMQLRIKDIDRGPEIDGERATMSASMTHKELGGPSVVWTFELQRTDGAWRVLSHSDK
jgi:hypothetical protein